MPEDPRGDARREAAEQQAKRDQESIDKYGLTYGWTNAPGPQRIPRAPRSRRSVLGRILGRRRR